MEKVKVNNKEIFVEIGKLAEQATGSCLLRWGETSVLVTAQIGKEVLSEFLPLNCVYQERYYAAGKILGSRYIRREGRPTTEEVLISRMIDRSIRPLFPKGFGQEIQVIATCLSWDRENDPAVLSAIGASIALTISEIPWEGPIGVVRIGKIKDKFIINPNYQEREEGEIDFVFSGLKQKDIVFCNMIEGGGKEVSEKDIVLAFEKAKAPISQLIAFQQELQKKYKRKKISFSLPSFPAIEEKIVKLLKDELEQALFLRDKKERKESLEELWRKIKEFIEQKIEQKELQKAFQKAKLIFEEKKEEVFLENILEKKRRPDGRAFKEIRKVKVKAGFLPRTHGSGLFSRGLTKTLSILTLGAPGDQQILEGMEIRGKKRFIHHYNFPPYSAGEIAPLRAPGRREIGHGALVERAILPLIPAFNDFPYTIRIVSEVLSSNGSTSMASVCSASLSLMDAGVPIPSHIAGIAIGLAKKTEEEYQLLTDIQGPEDYHGHMDFKVAGTRKGITAVQMDVKTKGISKKILAEALKAAKEAREEILAILEKEIPSPKKQLSPYAPRVFSLQVDPKKIGLVIGTGGRTINEIIESCGVSIDIEENGKIFVTGEKEEAAKKAVDWIKNITREIKVGEIFQGKVKRILTFGVIIELVPGQEGLCHISELAPFKIRKITDIIKVGDIIPVKVVSIDELGRIQLSAKKAGFLAKKRFQKKGVWSENKKRRWASF